MRHSAPSARRNRDRRLARSDAPQARPFLERLLSTPQLPAVVARLPPQVLHRVIRVCGLEDCGDLIALATPGQLRQVFDWDLWRQPRPGLDERLDADRFAVWLEVLMDVGTATAAQKLAGIEAELVIAALAQHVRVFDGAAVSPFITLDGEESSAGPLGEGPRCEVGGYIVEARRDGAWEIVAALLPVLAEEQPEYFHRVMRGCRRLSSSQPEADGLYHLRAAGDQDRFDLAIDREERREQQGYVTPAQARAFLHSARQVQLRQPTPPPPDPIAHAGFRALTQIRAGERGSSPDVSDPSAASTAADVPGDTSEAVAAFVDLLLEAGVLPPPPRALLAGQPEESARLARMRWHLQSVADIDHDSWLRRTEELTYLANTLVAACSIQGRPFTEREASDAVLAVCNLGLESWPHQWLRDGPRRGVSSTRHGALPRGFLVDHDLIAVFQVGWTVLHDEVSMECAGRLLGILREITCHDREIASAIAALRLTLTSQWRAGTPWRAREALDVIMMLDMPAWAALVSLLDDCPVIHAGLAASGSRAGTVSPTAFEFISEHRQIEAIRDFFETLPHVLRG
jgi:hypothetical protein